MLNSGESQGKEKRPSPDKSQKNDCDGQMTSTWMKIHKEDYRNCPIRTILEKMIIRISMHVKSMACKDDIGNDDLRASHLIHE
jgi:hypothetical protein